MKTLKNISKSKENMLVTKSENINKFSVPYDTLHKGFTLITGTNNDIKLDSFKNMLVDSCRKKSTLFIDTKGMLDSNSICLLSSHYLMEGKMRKYDVYEDGIPVNVFHVEPNKSNEEKANDLFDVCSSIYRKQDPNHMELLQEGMAVYVENPEDFTDCSAFEKARIERMQIFEFLSQALACTINDPFLHELHYSIEHDLGDCAVMLDSWENIIQYPGPAYYININSGWRDSAFPIADMLLASLRNYRKRNHDIPLDLYVNDFSDLNFSSTGSIGKIIEESERLNINVIGVSRDYYSPATPVGQIMATAEKQYFLFPTFASKDHIKTALQIGSSEDWPFKDMLYGNAILKEITTDPHTGKNVASVSKGRLKNYFSLRNYFGYND